MHHRSTCIIMELTCYVHCTGSRIQLIKTKYTLMKNDETSNKQKILDTLHLEVGIKRKSYKERTSTLSINLGPKDHFGVMIEKD